MDEMEPVKYCRCRARGNKTFVRYDLSGCGHDGLFLCLNGECLNITKSTYIGLCKEVFREKYGTAPIGTYYGLLKRVPEVCGIHCCLRFNNNTAVCHDFKDPPDKCRLSRSGKHT
ncbi:uncharacterized protein LOC121836319 [Ixodes scapularis]|uniref:uncharacterized protein LOC121836319 n=1 Tax=Ixodes scapularis TaxID=6945 RepID=UPI001C39038F|nr:uncharacterized protein LOC121836319 [Ixodes scapularis]